MSSFTKREGFVLFPLFLYPVLLPTVGHWGSTFTLLLLIMSVWYSRKERVFGVFDRKYLIALMLLLLSCLLSFINTSDVFRSWRSLEAVLYFAALFLFVPVARSVGMKTVDWVASGFAISGVATVIYSLFQQGGHLTGAYHHIFLGEVSAIGAVVTFGCLLKENLSKRLFVLYLIGFICTLYACVLSGSRGAWLGALLGMLLTILMYGRALFHKRNLVLLGLLLIIISVVTIAKKDFVMLRLNQIAGDISAYNSEDANKTTSLGSRFLMWSVAYDVWKEHPVIGSGLGDFKNDLVSAVKRGDIPGLPPYSQAHSLYFDFLSCVGLLGLTSMLFFVFIYPAHQAVRSLRKLSLDGRVCAIIGLSCLVAFAAFGLTDSWLNKRATVSLYVVTVSIFIFGSPFLSSEKSDELS